MASKTKPCLLRYILECFKRNPKAMQCIVCILHTMHIMHGYFGKLKLWNKFPKSLVKDPNTGTLGPALTLPHERHMLCQTTLLDVHCSRFRGQLRSGSNVYFQKSSPTWDRSDFNMVLLSCPSTSNIDYQGAIGALWRGQAASCDGRGGGRLLHTQPLKSSCSPGKIAGTVDDGWNEKWQR